MAISFVRLHTQSCPWFSGTRVGEIASQLCFPSCRHYLTYTRKHHTTSLSVQPVSHAQTLPGNVQMVQLQPITRDGLHRHHICERPKHRMWKCMCTSVLWSTV